MKSWRRRRELTQEELGARLATAGWKGADRRLVSKIEAGMRAVDLDELWFLCRALNVQARTLLLPADADARVDFGGLELDTVNAHLVWRGGVPGGGFGIRPDEERPDHERLADAAVPGLSDAIRRLLQLEARIGHAAGWKEPLQIAIGIDFLRAQLGALDVALAQAGERFRAEEDRATARTRRRKS